MRMVVRSPVWIIVPDGIPYPSKGDPPADAAKWTVSNINSDDSGIVLAPQTPEISF